MPNASLLYHSVKPFEYPPDTDAKPFFPNL